MKKIQKLILAVLGLILVSPAIVTAAGAYPVATGGTGNTTFTASQLLYGNGTNALSSVATTTASCAGTNSCSSFTIIGSSPVTITGSGGGSASNLFTTATNFAQTMSATSTGVWFQATPVSIAASGTIEGKFIDTDIFSGYRQGGSLLAYATSTTRTTTFGLQSGGQGATTSNVAINNSTFGFQVGNNLTTGFDNTFMGTQIGTANTLTGDNNVVMGFQAAQSLTTGSRNTIIGSQAAFNGTLSGKNNALFGYQSGENLLTGYDNVLVGPVLNTGGSNLTTGGGNITIGYNAFTPSATSLLKLNIGNLLFGQVAATSSATSVVAPTTGMFSVGSTSPFAEFSIQANNGYPTTTLFAIGSSTASATTTLFSIDNTGSTTAANGFNISNGCFAQGGVCLTNTVSNTTAFKQATQWATNAILSGTPTYSNGTGGVGATLTEVGTGALSVDGNAVSAGDRVLVKNEASQLTNGIYTVTAAGSGIAAYILTRATDYNSSADVYPGVSSYTIGGTANADTTWALTSAAPITIGTTALTYAESAASPVTLPLSIANGGTGQTSAANAFNALSPLTTAGDLLYGGASGVGTRLAAGSATQLLHSGTTPTWSAISLTADVTGRLPFANLTQVSANSLLGNITGSTADASSVATSSIFAGTIGQNAYFSGTGLLVGTSTIFESTASFVGIASSTLWSRLSIGTGLASSSITVAEYDVGLSGNIATSTAATIDARTANQVLWPIGVSATTLTICNMAPGQHLIVIVQNPHGASAGLVTFAVCAGSILEWAGQTAPTPTQTADASDVWSFTASGSENGTASSTVSTVIRGAMSSNF